METIIQHETYGKIVYSESFWTGKKKLYINDVELKKVNRKAFEYNVGEETVSVVLKGNTLTGMAVTIKEEKIQVVPKPEWYVILLSVLMFSFVMVWGNSVTLVKILPLIGGALGGGVSGIFAALNIISTRYTKNAWVKLVLGVVFFAATIVSCYVLARIVISAL